MKLTIQMPSSGDVLIGLANGGDSEMVATRIGANGRDTSFGAGGEAHVLVDGSNACVSRVTQGPRGTILADGTVERAGVRQLVVARFLSNGAVDPSFGTGGVAFVQAARLGEYIVDEIVAVQADGRVVVAATLQLDPDWQRPRILVARFTPDGKPDAQFAPAGYTTYWWAALTPVCRFWSHQTWLPSLHTSTRRTRRSVRC